jgi:hypothetical protein
MLQLMLLAHLIGDYILQWEFIVRWKSRSLMGVLAHGTIVTLTNLACTTLVDLSWWPQALVIGATHTAIDVVRARLIRTPQPARELAWFLVDQLSHLAIIVLVVTASGNLMPAAMTDATEHLVNPQNLTLAIGYLLLASPAWVLLRFTVRGLWGSHAAPHLGQGEKYGPMVERLLIATFILIGQYHLAPLVLLPRRLTPLHLQGQGVGMLLRPSGHWAETALSTLLAVGVGLALRRMSLGQ